ncbi:MAG: ABC transporter permease [Lachnospiraceae bacterium]|jgi:peptide/nickel transport system permease protein|nr:ABC transporter permease [Lachnospiraceae bacterium]
MRYIGKKIGMMLFTLLVVSLCVFLAFHLIPGDPALRQLGTNGTPEQLAALRHEMGLDRPVMVQYCSWLLGIFHGDLGSSYVYKIPVTGMLGEKIPITITLALMSFVIMILISLPLGIYTAKHKDGKIDHLIMVLNQVVMAVPPFFAGILLTLVFGMILKLFTPGGFVSYHTSIPGFLGYLFFPAIAIALPKSAMAVKLLRSSVIEEAGKDYTRTAYSRGNTTNAVLYRHVLQNAMIPVVTFMGMTLADMVAGSIVIEQVFGIPGISRILLTSINNRDYPVVEAIILGIATLVIVINLFVDVLYRILDPRIAKEDEA